MILPDGHEKMTDAELVDTLVSQGIYEPDEAQAVVELARHESASPQ